jgi:hypothetical protein
MLKGYFKPLQNSRHPHEIARVNLHILKASFRYLISFLGLTMLNTMT